MYHFRSHGHYRTGVLSSHQFAPTVGAFLFDYSDTRRNASVAHSSNNQAKYALVAVNAAKIYPSFNLAPPNKTMSFDESTYSLFSILRPNYTLPLVQPISRGLKNLRTRVKELFG